jgi:hypothetical protein
MAFGDEPAHGKETYGAKLDAAACDQIQSSDALIGFRTDEQYRDDD